VSEWNTRQQSRSGTTVNEHTLQTINTGSLQRIADACELMARRHQELLDNAEWYKRQLNGAIDEKQSMGRTIVGLRGQIGRLMKRIKELEKGVQP